MIAYPSPRSLLSTTALAGLLLSAPSAAFATCTGVGTVLCSGDNASGIVVNGPSGVAVTTAPGFAVETAADTALAITGVGDVSYVDENAASLSTTGITSHGLSVTANGDGGGQSSILIETDGAISGGNKGVLATNNGAGTVEITLGGTVEGGLGTGVEVVGGAGTTGVTVNAAEVTGGGTGIAVSGYLGTGDIHVGSSGDVTGETLYGVYVTSATVGNVTVDIDGNVEGMLEGVSVSNSGSGGIDITVDGTATGGAGAHGVYAENSGGTDVDIEVGGASGGLDGIHVMNSGGASSIIAHGAATGGTGYNGITLYHSGTGDASIEATEVTGGLYGAYVENTGLGDTTLTLTGDVVAEDDGSTGLMVTNGAAAGSLTIEAASIEGGWYGIRAINNGTGETHITSTGLLSNGSYGAWATSVGDMFVDVTGIEGGTGGLYLESTGGNAADVTVRGGVSGSSSAIYATGTSAVDILIEDDADVRNSSGLSSSTVVNVRSGDLTLTNEGTLTGRVLSLDGDDAVINRGSWSTGGSVNDLGTGENSITNEATGVISAASDALTLETTSFNRLDFVNHGTFDLSDGGAGDVVTIVGDLSFEAGSDYRLDVNLAGIADRIDVTGGVTIDDGARVTVASLDGIQFGYDYLVLSATEGVTGGFGEVVSAFVGLRSTNDGDDVYVRLGLTQDFEDVAATPNQSAVADAIPDAGDLYEAVLLLPDEDTAREAFDALSGDVHASTTAAFVDNAAFVRTAALDRLRGAFTPEFGTGGISVAPLGYADAEPHSRVPFPPSKADPAFESVVWTQAYGSWGSIAGDGNAAKVERNSGGFFVGADTLVGDDWRIGVVGGYGRSTFESEGVGSSGDSDNFQAGIYGGREWGGLSLRLGAGYDWHDVETHRDVVFPGFSEQLSARYDAGTAQAFGEVAYRIALGRVALQPFTGVSYVRASSDGFTEKGGTAALTVDESTEETTYTTVGLRSSSALSLGGNAATLRGMLGWRHGFGDAPVSTVAFAGGPRFDVSGLPIAEDVAVVEAGLDLAVTARTTLGLTYSGQFGDDAEDHGLQGNLARRF